MNAREELFDRLYMLCLKADCKPWVKEEMYIILSGYDVANRSTELSVMCEDRNQSLIKKFIISKTVKGCSERTVKLYSTELPKILEKIGKAADEICSDDIRLYLAKRLRVDKVSATTANNELRYLGSFFKYLLDEEIIGKNPVTKVERIKNKKKEADTFSELEVERIRECIKDERNKAIIELLFSTGCRVSELVNIKLTDMDGNKILVHGKGNKDRIVYINPKALVSIEKYICLRNDNNPYLFPAGTFGESRKARTGWWKNPELVSDGHITISSIEELTKRIGKKLGIIPSNPHKFRKTCATLALKRGMPIEQVSRMLGHEQISTTQIYLNIDREETEAYHKKYVI